MSLRACGPEPVLQSQKIQDAYWLGFGDEFRVQIRLRLDWWAKCQIRCNPVEGGVWELEFPGTVDILEPVSMEMEKEK